MYKKKELQLSYFSICEGKKLDDKIVTYFALKAGSTVCHQKKIVIERTRDLIYLKFVATDFSHKITSPSTGENSGDSA